MPESSLCENVLLVLYKAQRSVLVFRYPSINDRLATFGSVTIDHFNFTISLCVYWISACLYVAAKAIMLNSLSKTVISTNGIALQSITSQRKKQGNASSFFHKLFLLNISFRYKFLDFKTSIISYYLQQTAWLTSIIQDSNRFWAALINSTLYIKTTAFSEKFTVFWKKLKKIQKFSKNREISMIFDRIIQNQHKNQHENFCKKRKIRQKKPRTAEAVQGRGVIWLSF